MKRCGARHIEDRGLAALAAAMLLMATVSSATAGIIQPRLSVAGGTGVPGGTVSITLGLADDIANAAVTAGVDLLFEDDKLDFTPPVSASCDIDPRLATTHSLAGRILSPGVLNLEILVLGTPEPPLPLLGNGNLASCDFRIQDDAPLGSSPLVIESPFLGDAAGMAIPVIVENGAVQIVEAIPTETPTITVTPQSTSTVTVTPEVTPTATDTPSIPVTTATVTPTDTPPTEATSTATSTRTVTEPTVVTTPTATHTSGTPSPTATRTGNTPTRTVTALPANDDDGCNVAPPGSSNLGGTLALLLGPALLIWVRRRG